MSVDPAERTCVTPQSAPEDPIAYTLRVSPRAKHVRITVTRAGEVVVTIPKRFAERRVPALVEERRVWIARARARAAARAEAVRAEHGEGLPAAVTLRATGESLAVAYRASAADGVTAREGGGTLALSGATHDEAAVEAALRRWLVRRAHEALGEMVREVASANGFHVTRVRIGLQRSRWGSCSPRGTVSLNAKLLFLEPELARYVVLHELCHTRAMDHSARFWAIVAEHDPGFERHRRALKDAGRFVPPWAG